MAEARIGYRRNAIGISAGLGIALPLAAYAATIPFDEVNAIVRSDAMPFAVGAAAGVGLLAVTGRLLDAHVDRAVTDEAQGSRDANPAQTSAKPFAVHPAEQTATLLGGKRFAHNGTPSGVPVIARAVDAMDEAEAWAEIDAMFSDGSPFSCDPARSKDMYQIALEELHRSEQAPSRPDEVVDASSQQAADPSSVRVVLPVDREEADARDDAMASLYGAAAVSRSYAPAMPTMSGEGIQRPVVATRDRARAYDGHGAVHGDAPVVTDAIGAQGGVTTSSQHQEHADVPMADYSGHEAMWAAALAVLDEDVSSIASDAVDAVQVEPGATSQVDARRVAAVAEGHLATRMHSHVNSIIEEEFDKVTSKSVNSTAHEYLKVIEGGTMGMPALHTAEG